MIDMVLEALLPVRLPPHLLSLPAPEGTTSVGRLLPFHILLLARPKAVMAIDARKASSHRVRSLAQVES